MIVQDLLLIEENNNKKKKKKTKKKKKGDATKNRRCIYVSIYIYDCARRVDVLLNIYVSIKL